MWFGQLMNQSCSNPQTTEPGQFLWVLADDQQVRMGLGNHLRAEIPETPIPQHNNAGESRQVNLCRDLKGCCQWFREDGGIIGDMVRNRVEIALRQPDAIRKGPIMIQNSEDSAMGTMCRSTLPTRFAVAATRIDFPDNPLTCVFPFFSDSDELMTQDPMESHVAPDQLEVCFTNPRAKDSNGDLSRKRIVLVIGLKLETRG